MVPQASEVCKTGTKSTSAFCKKENWMVVRAALCLNSTTSGLSQYCVWAQLASGLTKTLITLCATIMQQESTVHRSGPKAPPTPNILVHQVLSSSWVRLCCFWKVQHLMAAFKLFYRKNKGEISEIFYIVQLQFAVISIKWFEAQKLTHSNLTFFVCLCR